MEARVIKRDDGMFLVSIFSKRKSYWTDSLIGARTYPFADAKYIIKIFSLNDYCKPVKVRIEEVEE